MSGLNPSRPPLAVLYGCAGLRLSDDERALFRETDPLGFILFARNCDAPDQVRALVEDLKATVGRDDAPVLIDQEGGRVARLKPPHWRQTPAAGRFGALARQDLKSAREAVFLNARLLAAELSDLGISVDCAPVLDLPTDEADPIIGDRAFGNHIELTIDLGRAACEGFLAGGVLPVLKHVPGHGRAPVDSHLRLPVVHDSRADLEATDFAPFKALAQMPWMMSAHVVYTDLDPAAPASCSLRVVHEVIRVYIGFDGVLVSDDLSMKALRGSFNNRAKDVLSAGCDLVLHCNGDMDEMEAVAKGSRALDKDGLRRVAAAEARRASDDTFDVDAALLRRDALLSVLES
ncbi:beta-N-acetylhexosaminidase [Magnetospira sp. QH-2]|uniref:beta-N-acetylhexosaminidase n=1 Tax=Magnetospira sp. (strain QH-2) TaxID=1288970 RepID=UPI0003E80ECC|nr:beta-N-acetylhexosaminidase [Magnetospira sp. QH-2]CCQ73625.1 GH3 : related to N-acetyl-b-glucosaminidase [Magnetospira sp. QH-2]